MIAKNFTLGGGSVYVENNPSDPKEEHTALYNNKMLTSITFKHAKVTIETIKDLVKKYTPVSVGWSNTDKQIICTTIPCICCGIEVYVHITCYGQPTKENDPVPVNGLYRVSISSGENEEIHVLVSKLDSSKEIYQGEYLI